MPHVATVGAGAGGLATALRLAHRGCQVTVLERRPVVGGRNSRVTVEGHDFDGGPTLLMMREPFERLFTDVGEKLEDHLDLTLCDPAYRVFWRDGSSLEATPNMAVMIQRLQALVGRKEAESYAKLLGDLGAMYRDAVPAFVRRNYRSMLDLANPKDVGMVLRHGLLKNYAKQIERRFEDPRLRMLFSFQTMYLGLSPYEAPWVYGVLAYMELGEGIWHPKGGLPAVTESIARLAESKGVTIRTGVEVKEIQGDGVETSEGFIAADAVVCNADLPIAEADLLHDPQPKRKTSCSGLVLRLVYRGELPELRHHNVFFSGDFKGNLEAIFADPPRLPDDPSFYACLANRTQPDRGQEGHENLFILIPCPNLDGPMTDAQQDALAGAAFTRLCEGTSFDPANIVARSVTGPMEWEQEYGLERGAAFGLSHHFGQSVCFRPGNRRRKGLYFVGASTVPGNGLPMVLISAELAEERLERDGFLK